MTWDCFYIFAAAFVILAVSGALVALFSERKARAAFWLTAGAVAVLVVFIAGLWISLGRPPMKTMGETRLWYSFFVSVTGLAVFARWRFRWILPLTSVMASVFCIINVMRPEIHDQTLMPALQSLWFIPHVTVYMTAYGILACACLVAVMGLVKNDLHYLGVTDLLVYIGTALLFLGLLMGAVWAKQAWGNFWEWDPKETWAAVTCAVYLLYIHLRLSGKAERKMFFYIVIAGFLLMQMCWYGCQYIPASENSMHMYNISK